MKQALSLTAIAASLLLSISFSPMASAADTAPEKASSETVATASTTGIKWYAYEKGMELGRQEAKKIFLSFYADWCKYCKKMEKETFSQPEIISYMNENYIAIKVNTDKQGDIARKYLGNQIRLPTTWFLNEEGDGIGNQPGYLSPGVLMPMLKYINTDSYKEMAFDAFMKTE